MGMGDQYAINIVLREIKMCKAGLHMIKEMNIARVNQYLFRSGNQIGVRIIRPSVSPDKGVKVFCNLHGGILLAYYRGLASSMSMIGMPSLISYDSLQWLQIKAFSV
jgi:hypothetical protein